MRNKLPYKPADRKDVKVILRQRVQRVMVHPLPEGWTACIGYPFWIKEWRSDGSFPQREVIVVSSDLPFETQCVAFLHEVMHNYHDVYEYGAEARYRAAQARCEEVRGGGAEETRQEFFRRCDIAREVMEFLIDDEAMRFFVENEKWTRRVFRYLVRRR